MLKFVLFGEFLMYIFLLNVEGVLIGLDFFCSLVSDFMFLDMDLKIIINVMKNYIKNICIDR